MMEYMVYGVNKHFELDYYKKRRKMSKGIRQISFFD